MEMSQTGEHPAVEDHIDPPLLEERTRKTLADVRILIGAVCFMCVTVFGGGYAVAQQIRTEAQETAATSAKTETAGIRTEQEAQKRAIADLGAEVADTKAEVRGLRQDLRALFPALPRLPKDGGQ
jgi:cell division protein FtsB